MVVSILWFASLIASMTSFGLPRRGQPSLWQRGFFFGKLIGVATLFDFGQKRCRRNLPIADPRSMIFVPMLAMFEMRGNLIGAAILLMIGVVVFRLVRPPSATTSSRCWLPIVAFITGPAVAFLWTIADVLWIQPGSYLNFAEYLQASIPVLIVGVVGGAVGAFVFWVGDRITLRRVR